MGSTFSTFEEQSKTELQRFKMADPDFYRLVNDSGGGELVELMKNALKTKDFSLVDKTIKEKVVKYLYNDGRGDYIDVEELVKARMSTKDGYLKKFLQDNENKPKDRNQIRYTKYVCFDIEKRGKYGETILCLCLRNCTTIHNELAKRLINIFPQMINDFSLNAEFYGETALHLAISNEDAEMVRLLISKRANIHARCFGSMFAPDDQKLTRKDVLTSEFPIVPKETSYKGLSYFGEYPLTFAACLNQEECVRLILAKGVDTNRQDLNGNTALHMMVIQNNLKMFQLLWGQTAADINLKNRQGLTPLALSAQLSRSEIYEHILEDIRDVNWTYADVSCAAYPLEDLDSIGPNGETDFTSLLMVLVNSHHEEHLEFFNGVIIEMITQKWKHYIKFKFYIEFAIFLIFLLICGVTVILKRLYFEHIIEQGCTFANEKKRVIIPECKCVYLYPSDSNRYLRMIFEILAIVFTIFYVALFTTELLAQKLIISIQTLISNPFKFVFMCSLLSNLLIIPMRFTCNIYGEDILVCISIITMPFYILYIARGFRRMSIFLYTIHIGIKKNLYVWFCISMIFFMGFSQSMYIAAGYGASPVVYVFQTPLQSIMDCLVFSDHDFVVGYDNLKISPYPVVGKTVFFFTAIMCNVIMTNMLIASFLELYAEVVHNKLEWIRQWALTVICLEQTMKPKDRLKQQQKYVQYMYNGQKSIVHNWSEELQERLDSKTSKIGQVRNKLLKVPDNENEEYIKKNN